MIVLKVDKIVLHSQSVRYVVRGNRAIAYTTPEYKKFSKEIRKQIPSNIKNHYGILEVRMVVIYPIPKSYTKKKRDELRGQLKSTSPDIDNVAKSILDALEGYLFDNDSLIAKLNLSKEYSTDLEANKIIIEIKVTQYPFLGV